MWKPVLVKGRLNTAICANAIHLRHQVYIGVLRAPDRGSQFPYYLYNVLWLRYTYRKTTHFKIPAERILILLSDVGLLLILASIAATVSCQLCQIAA